MFHGSLGGNSREAGSGSPKHTLCSWSEPWKAWPPGNGGASRTLSGRPCVGGGGTELGVLFPIPKISRFSSGHKKSLNPGFRLFAPGCPRPPTPEPTSSAQTFLLGLDFVTVSPPLVVPGHNTITSERGKAGGPEVGHWVTRVGWEVAGIQAGAINSGGPPQPPRCHKRSWPKMCLSTVPFLQTDGVCLT